MVEYRAPAWLPGGHLQTVAGALRFWPALDYQRERWDTPDGDFVDVDQAGPSQAPRCLVLFHGLEGHSRAPYARKIGALVLERGWRFAVPHFRGCSGETNRRLRSYHAGVSDEVGWILEAFARRQGGPVCAAGVSLGGNALLKWLGEQGASAARTVRSAVAICAPLDMQVTGEVLAHGVHLLYAKYFLRFHLRERALRKLDAYPGAYDRERVKSAGTLREFDDAVTAPVHGFAGVDDYWTRTSAIRYLGGIRVPTLLLNARNDPFLPDAVLRRLEQARDTGSLPKEVQLDFPAEGGHVGFPGGQNWLANRVYEFLGAP